MIHIGERDIRRVADRVGIAEIAQIVRQIQQRIIGGEGMNALNRAVVIAENRDRLTGEKAHRALQGYYACAGVIGTDAARILIRQAATIQVGNDAISIRAKRAGTVDVNLHLRLQGAGG